MLHCWRLLAISALCFGCIDAFHVHLPSARAAPRLGSFSVARSRPTTGLHALSVKGVGKTKQVRDYSPFKAAVDKNGWLASKESQMAAYSALAVNWLFAGFLHITVFSCLISASVANHAMFALAYGHLSLVISALLSLGKAAENNLLAASTYRRLNVALASSGFVGLVVMLWPTVVNTVTTGAFVFKNIPKFSQSPLAVFTACWTVGLLLMTVLVPRRVWSVNFLQGELKGLSLASELMATVKEFFRPKSFSGAVYRIAAGFLLAQALLATLAPATMLSLTGSAVLVSSGIGPAPPS